MVSTWTLSSFLAYAESSFLLDAIAGVISLAAIGLVIATFVLSIIHLKCYPEKGLAITALVISSIGLLIITLAFLYGIILAISGL